MGELEGLLKIMIRHYLSLAWQQLEKYRLQSLVSIVSLAIGFACFALASMWIKYETTYDAFHKDAENIYVVTQNKGYVLHMNSKDINIRALQEVPELESLTYVTNNYIDSINGKRVGCVQWLMNDTNLVNLFGLEIMEGTTSFVHNEHEIAISDRLAKRLWKDESPIGKPLIGKHTLRGSNGVLKYEQTLTVSAVFRSWGEHSNFYFDMLSRRPADFLEEFGRSKHIMAHVSPKVDIKKLNAKLDSVKFVVYDKDMPLEEYLGTVPSRLKPKIVPLTELYHSNAAYENSTKFKFNHIYLFSIACGLLILCALLNYLTMFINRLFIRKREIALRTVFGASGRDLTVQFLTEYGLLLVLALLLGLLIAFGLMDDFLTLADLQLGRRAQSNLFISISRGILPELKTFFAREVLLYTVLVFVVSILISIPFIWYFRRQSLQSSITGVGGLAKYNIFRYFSTGIQIGISILCIFCTVVLLKQLHALRHGDIGFEIENRMYYRMSRDDRHMEEGIIQFLRSCPEVDTLIVYSSTIYPATATSSIVLRKNKFPDLAEEMKVPYAAVSEEIVDFYGLKLLQGRWPHENEYDAIVVNEAFVHQSGWKNPLEKSIHHEKIVGVVKDFHNVSPLIKSEPYILRYYKYRPIPSLAPDILFRYKPGMKETLMTKVETFFKEKELKYEDDQWNDLMEMYNYMLKSEDNLRLLLSITSGICILIALFGVWSMIMLTCEQRRKEIAVRKVFGATTKDILDMFIVEYMALQGVAALVAFPIGYACMKPWLEQYVVQTSIPWWIYVGIFLLVALLVALCIGWRVWKTATAHPADEICKG